MVAQSRHKINHVIIFADRFRHRRHFAYTSIGNYQLKDSSAKVAVTLEQIHGEQHVFHE